MDADDRHRLQEALARLAGGDRSAFHPVFTLCWPVVSRFTRALLRGAPDAEDAAQEALLRVFARAPEFDRAREALPWVLAIAFHQCRTLRRRAQRRREDALPARAGTRAAASPEADLVQADLARAAREVLEGLPPLDAQTLLAALEGAAPEGVAPATFRKRLERARERLRRAFRERHGVC
jgi:RNA polymerase sigma-70 factor (ECF subfamily)